MNTANTNLATGIAFGYVASNELDSEVVHELLYGHNAIDHNYQAWLAEKAVRDAAIEAEGGEPDENEEYEDNGQDASVSGIYEGVTYQSSTLGGALNFFITESPVTTDLANHASPCVPNCGILSKDMDGSTTSYSVPSDWWAEQV